MLRGPVRAGGVGGGHKRASVLARHESVRSVLAAYVFTVLWPFSSNDCPAAASACFCRKSISVFFKR
jgi:hypothetical protein